jgi:hypothetical protein
VQVRFYPGMFLLKMSKLSFCSLQRIAILCLLVPIGLAIGAPKTTDLSRLVVVGDSLSAGFHNFSLYQETQVKGYAKLIADQAGRKMVLPLVPYPGVPNMLRLVSPGPPPVVEPLPGPGPAMPRVDPFAQLTNFAVPGVYLADLLNKRPGTAQTDGLTDLVLGFPTPFITPGIPKSQVERALELNPTTLIVWAGNNDALMAVLTGNMKALTPVDKFAASYQATLRALARPGRTLVTANIPDVTAIPYLTPVASLASQAKVPSALVALFLGVTPFDYLQPSALPIALDILQRRRSGPLPKQCPSAIQGLPITQVPCSIGVLDIARIKAAVFAYNMAIERTANSFDAVLVDVNELFNDIAQKGYKLSATKRLTSEFLGGLFSLDGIHPTNTGNAVIANEFIKQLNKSVSPKIPSIDVEQVSKTDPLVF